MSTQSETAEKPVIMPPPISHPPKKGTLAYFFNKPDSASKDTIVLETPPGALNFTTNHNADIVPSGDPSIISSNPTMTPMQGNMLLSQSLFLHRERDDDIEDELDGLLSGKPANSIGNINLGINLAMNSTIKSSSCSTIDSSVVVVATASLTIMEESKEEYEEHDDEPSASIADVIPKGVKIRRGKAILFDESDDDDEDEEGAGGGDDDEEGVEGTNSLRFGEIKASHPFQKPSSDAFAGLASLIGPNPTAPPKKSAYIEEEAEEEDDEFKGLGGIDGEDLGGIDLDKDDPNLVVKDEDMGDPLEGMDDVVALHL